MKIDRVFERGHYRPGPPADGLVLARVLLRPPRFGHDVGPDPLLHLAAHVEQAGPGGRAQPFVAGRRIGIHPQVVDVDRDHAGNLGAVREAEQPFGLGQLGQFFDRGVGADHGIAMRGGDGSRARCNRHLEGVQNLVGARRRRPNRNFLHHDPLPLGLH